MLENKLWYLRCTQTARCLPWPGLNAVVTVYNVSACDLASLGHHLPHRQPHQLSPRVASRHCRKQDPRIRCSFAAAWRRDARRGAHPRALVRPGEAWVERTTLSPRHHPDERAPTPPRAWLTVAAQRSFCTVVSSLAIPLGLKTARTRTAFLEDVFSFSEGPSWAKFSFS